MKKINKR